MPRCRLLVISADDGLLDMLVSAALAVDQSMYERVQNSGATPPLQIFFLPKLKLELDDV